MGVPFQCWGPCYVTRWIVGATDTTMTVEEEDVVLNAVEIVGGVLVWTLVPARCKTGERTASVRKWRPG